MMFDGVAGVCVKTGGKMCLTEFLFNDFNFCTSNM